MFHYILLTLLHVTVESIFGGKSCESVFEYLTYIIYTITIFLCLEYSLPVHVTPLPSYPVLHLHVNDEAVSVQAAFTSQL